MRKEIGSKMQQDNVYIRIGSKHFEYLSQYRGIDHYTGCVQGIPYALFLGPREARSGRLTLRDMKTGKEKKLKIPGIIKKLK